MNTKTFFTAITDLFAIGAQDFKLGTDNSNDAEKIAFPC
jgi:hypothetical protein